MKNLSSALLDKISSRAPTLTACALMTRTDGAQLGFTSFNEDIVIDGVIYPAKSAIILPQLETKSELEVSNTTLETIFDSDRITEGDLYGGRYDDATVRIFMVDYEDLPTTLDEDPASHIDIAPLFLLGNVTNKSGFKVALEVRGLFSRLTQDWGDTSSRTCRYEFGDNRCGKYLDPITVPLEVTEVYSGLTYRFEVNNNGQGGDDYFTDGWVVFTSGANVGLPKQGVRQYGSQIFELWKPLPLMPAVGDKLLATAGCDKTFNGARGCIYWDNKDNFGGEKDLVGTDRQINGGVY